MNPLGGILLLFVPLGVVIFFVLLSQGKKKIPFWKRMPYLAGIAFITGVQGLAILWATSINTWVALFISLIMLVRWGRNAKLGLSLLILLGIITMFLNVDLKKRENYQGIRGTISLSLITRIDIWRSAIEVAKKHPLNGIGMDQLRRSPKYSYENSHAHNQFFHTVAELGMAGLLAYTTILGVGFRKAKEAMKYPLPEWMKMESRGLGSGLLGFTLLGMLDAIPLGAKPGILFWIAMALIISFFLYGKGQKKAEDKGELHG